MNRGFTKLMAALALLTFLIPVAGWGQTNASYTITFANNASSATEITSSTQASTVIANDGSRSYVTSSPFTVNTGKCYYGDTRTCIRIGKSGNSSMLTIALSDDGKVSATSIVVNCNNIGGSNNSNAELNVNSLGQQTTTSTAANYTFSFANATAIQNIVLEGTASIRIYSITVNYIISGGSGGSNSGLATLTQSNLELTGSYTTNTSKTIDGITYVYTDLMKNNTDIQAKASSGTIRNTTPYTGDITSVAITHTGTARATTIYGSADGTNWSQVATGNGSINADFSNYSYRYFKITRGSNAAYWEKIDIAYSTDGTSTPSITAADVSILYSATSGSIAYTINNEPTPAGTLSVDTVGVSTIENLVFGNATSQAVPFTCAANTTTTARTATVRLTYTYGDNETVTKDMTITQDAAPAPVINASNVSIAFDATSGSIAYSITNEPNPAGTMTAAVVSGGTIANLTIGTIANNTVAFTCAANNTTTAHTATVTLTYTYANNLTVTKNVTVTQAASSFEYALLPFAFDGNATAVADVAGLSQQGLDSYATQLKLQFNTTGDWLLLRFNERPGQLSYDIKGNSFSGSTFKVQASADGTNFTDVAIYTNLTSDIQHITINNLDANVRYIKWVYTNKNAGNVALGNIALAEYQPPQQYTLTVGTPQNVTIHVYNGNSHIATNNGSASVFSGTEITLNLSVFTGYVLDLVTVYDAQDNLISLTQVSETVFSFIMPSSNVTVSADVAGAHAPYNYTLATTFVPGKRYIIVAENYGTYYAMGAQKNNNRNAKPISVEGNTATVTRADVHEFTIGSIDGAPGYYSIYDEDPESHRYLYAGSSSSNSLRDTTQLIVHGKWAISIDANTSEASIVANANGANTHNVMRFNQANLLFSCYTANNNQYPVYLYVKEDGFALTIDGYTDDNVKDGYYLIASPVEVDPADVPGLTEGTFDLYYYDDSQDLEWINYETSNGINPDFGNLVPGKGYLYAKKAANGISEYTFTLTGEVYNGNGIVELEEGWNLIGNPWPQEAEFYADVFYVMNEQGSDIIPGEEYIAQPMQGFFAYDEYGGSTVEFIPSSSGAKAVGLSLNLTRDRGVIDRAIVRFGEGRQLPKFQLNPDNTKVYITQGDRDYAVVYSANEGELPVSFKAERNGTYTLSANLEGVSLDYLHLIDNLTGADVDLLVTPSYSFEARTTDYACRFRLVFSAEENGTSTGSATFAFFNGSEWVVDNEGEATLQVVDVMGRVLSSETVNGNATLSLEQTPGVYMLRLVTADGVKVQRVVVD